jgi:hypothetical protein
MRTGIYFPAIGGGVEWNEVISYSETENGFGIFIGQTITKNKK